MDFAMDAKLYQGLDRTLPACLGRVNPHDSPGGGYAKYPGWFQLRYIPEFKEKKLLRILVKSVLLD
jgi:hypothetical protein